MKKTTLLHLFLSAAALAAPLVPISTRAAAGDRYVADQTAGTIFKFTPDGTQSTFTSGLGAPAGVAFDGKGNLFVRSLGTTRSQNLLPLELRARLPLG